MKQDRQTDERAGVPGPLGTQVTPAAAARTATCVKRLPQLILRGCQQRWPPPGVCLNAICWSRETTPSPAQNSSASANCCSAPLPLLPTPFQGSGAENGQGRHEDGEGGEEGEQ